MNLNWLIFTSTSLSIVLDECILALFHDSRPSSVVYVVIDI